MAIIVEDGSGISNAQALVSIDEIKAYYEFHQYPIDLTDDVVLEALAVTSTRQTLTGITFKGRPTKFQNYVNPVDDAYQALPFPRSGVYITYNLQRPPEIILGNENIGLDDYVEIPSTMIPGAIKDAICENCRFISAADRAVDKDTANIVREKIDVIEVEYEKGTSAGVIPDSVLSIMADFIAVSQQSNGVPAQTSARMRRW